MTDKVVVLSTCESVEDAERIADLLVEQRLAACVNIVGGVRSVYRWKEAVERASEVLLLIKTSRALVQDVRAAIAQEHSYELPECIAVPIIDGSEPYLSWLEQGLRNKPETAAASE
jgi:periplasmic divalent cation tolerance protein